MARKDILANLSGTKLSSATKADSDTNASKSFRTTGTLGSVGKSLAKLSESVGRAGELEKQLKAGLTIIEIDTELVDPAFIRDRLNSTAGIVELAEKIKYSGQLSPILVRPSPSKNGHYQIAFGHRRLAACKLLGIKVKACVRDLSDEQLIVALGQENSARTDLSFIEKSLFALSLERTGYDRAIIMESLGVDKTLLSRMISIACKMPENIISFLGPCLSIGRDKWQTLAKKLDNKEFRENCYKRIAENSESFSTDKEKFDFILKSTKKDTDRTSGFNDFINLDNKTKVNFSGGNGKVKIQITSTLAEEFNCYMKTHISDIYSTFLQNRLHTSSERPTKTDDETQ